MKLKKVIAIALSAATIASVAVGCEAAKKASATPTMVQAVAVPQMLMNLDGNANYLLVWNHVGTRFYIDLFYHC